MTRLQDGLIWRFKEATDPNGGMPHQLGRVVRVNRKRGTVDVALRYGGTLTNVKVLKDIAGTNEGSGWLPDVDSGKTEDATPTFPGTGTNDSFCVVGYIEGRQREPYVIGFVPPPQFETSFEKVNVTKFHNGMYQVVDDDGWEIHRPDGTFLRIGATAASATVNAGNASPDQPFDGGAGSASGAAKTTLGGDLQMSGSANISGVNALGAVTGNITTVAATSLGGTLTTAAQPNVTSIGSLAGITVNGNITFTGASRKIIAGTTNLSIRNNADSQDNILITDAGAVTVFGSVVVPALNLAETGRPGTTMTSTHTVNNEDMLTIQVYRGGTNLTRIGVIQDGTLQLQPSGGNVTVGADLTATGTLTGATVTATGALNGASAAITGALTAASVAAGTTPAASGALRIPNNAELKGRNAANSADISLIGAASTDNAILLGGQRILTRYSGGNSGATPTADWANGDTQSWTANAATVTWTLSNPITGRTYSLEILQDGTGSRIYAWPASVKWSGGTAPIGSGANKTDLISLFWNGTNYLGSAVLNY